jgi:hypothetical protein
MPDHTFTATTLHGKPAVLITAVSPRTIRRLRREIEAAGFWTLTVAEPTYGLLTDPSAVAA